MISDADRREMAATMRAISVSGLRNLTLGEMLNSILTRGAPRPTTEMAILASLADLIDRPTCSMTECGIDNGSRSWGMRCSACGAKFEHEKPSYGWNYCPHCGAEVER